MTKKEYIEAAMMFRKAAKEAVSAGNTKDAATWWWAAQQGIKYARNSRA